MTSAPRLIFLLLLVLLSTSGCGTDPIVVGFLGPLEGKYSDLGVQGRNGATLAIEEINAAGGVAGRQLLLLSMDDTGDEPAAAEAVRALARRGASAVIGPMTSAAAMAMLTASAQSNLVLVSPTVSTELLSGRRDNFFRVIPSSVTWSRAIANQCRKVDGHRRLATICDLGNESYARPYAEEVARTFRAEGGTVVAELQVRGPGLQDWRPLAAQLMASGADAFFCVLSARDLALLARDLRLAGAKAPIYSAMWAMTPDILQAGGLSVEGIRFAVGYDENNPRPDFQAFKQRYQNRFGFPPSFAAGFGYEAAMVLAKALRKTGGQARGLAEAMTSLGPMESIQGRLLLDEYGDVTRPAYLMTIHDHAFVTLGEIEE